jgi:hypothetical protein
MRSEEMLSPVTQRTGFLVWPGKFTASAFALIAAVLILGCSSNSENDAGAAKTAASQQALSPDTPHVITSLSQISSSNTDAASLNNAAKVLKTHPSSENNRVVVGIGQDTPSVLQRLFSQDPESPRYVETDIPHVQVRLLNAKAAKYAGFTNMMLTQLIEELAKEEKMPPIVKLQLSEQIRPVIVTAVLNQDGQLKELIYDQHSGLAVIDDFVIASSKASLWANNLPKGAASPDGNYRLRIETQISNYKTDRSGNHIFLTRVGMGVL